MSKKVLMKGNEAFAEAAIRAGCSLYFGYPITPQNEIPEYMSRELHKNGGTFAQAESELAAVNMAYGGALAGKDVFISSSSPGIALMQEGISFMASAEIPVVIMNVSRGGPGVGGIQPGQSDYRQATKGGGNGDYHIPVFAPASIQETVDILYDAVPIATKYKNPVMILVDGMMGQMMEPVRLPEKRKPLDAEEIEEKKGWALTGHENLRARRTVVSLHLKPNELEEHNEHLEEKYRRMKGELVKCEARDIDGADLVFVSFGTMSRIVNEAKEHLKKEGINAGIIRPVSLWPFPENVFDEIGSSVKAVISAELSLGQMMEDVKSAVAGRFPVSLVHRVGGMVPTPMEVAQKAKKILEGQYESDI